MAGSMRHHEFDGVPGGVDPRDFVGKKFEEIEDACDGDDPGVAEDLERLVGRRERDPMLVNRESGHENREIKIDSSQASKPERDAQQVESIHGAISDPARGCHVHFS